MDIIRVAIVDDHELFRQGIALLIHNIPEFELLFEANDGSDCLEKLEGGEQLPHVALVDMEMPVMDGLALNEQLHALYPQIKVIVLSIHAKERLIATMIRAGVSGYLIKNCDKNELITAIKMVHTSGFYINAQVLKAIQVSSTQPNATKNTNGILIEITQREQEVLKLICQEYNNTEIAEKLFISPRTVEGHRNNLLTKTGCRNTAGLVLFSVKHHLYNVMC
jgi:DNA-binding NarL/FixJ family response regulator